MAAGIALRPSGVGRRFLSQSLAYLQPTRPLHNARPRLNDTFATPADLELSQASLTELTDIFDTDAMRIKLLDQHVFIGTPQHFGLASTAASELRNRFLVQRLPDLYDPQAAPEGIADLGRQRQRTESRLSCI